MEKQRTLRIPWWLMLLEGIALLVLGILFLVRPGVTFILAIQFLGIYWLVVGVLRLVSLFIDSSFWGWKLFIGILGIIAGVIVLQHPLIAPIAVGSVIVIILGIEGIIMGIIGLIHAFQGAGWGAGIVGLFSLAFGIILLANVLVATFTLPIVLGALALAGGIITIIAAFQTR